MPEPDGERGLGARSGLYAALALIAGAATFAWALAHQRLLLYGDATAHLAIARRMVDSATPGLSQWGTVWLPLPHLLMAVLVWNNWLWRTGIAGSLPSLAALVLGTWLLHQLVRRECGPVAAGWAASLYALNPSLLYLAAVPMTESIYLAAFLGLVNACSLYATEPVVRRAWQAGAWGLAASMCRYDGWFVLPFALLALWVGAPGPKQGREAGWRFCVLAGAGPVFWFAYNAFYLGDPLAFARGPYSARQIYLNALRHGGLRYPGDHVFGTAALYFLKTVVLTCGEPLLILGLAALVLLQRRWRARPAAWLVLLPLPWYVWAMWSGNVPIFVPQYWPHGYYNLRYGVQMLPAAALFSGVLVGALAAGARRVLVPQLRTGIVAGLAILCGAAYLGMLRGEGPIAYAEAVHNAPDRLSMEHQLAAALASRQPGETILMYYGSYPGALADDGIAVRSVIQEANFRVWQAALARPSQHVQWVVVEAGSPTAAGINRADLREYFHPVADLSAPRQPGIQVYRRNDR